MQLVQGGDGESVTVGFRNRLDVPVYYKHLTLPTNLRV